MLLSAQDAVLDKKKGGVAEKKENKTDFIRVLEENKKVKLQTSVTRYVKDDVKVDLIGAVHVADKKYFMDLNALFVPYDVLLFEMIGGDRMKQGKKLEEGKPKDMQFIFLGAMYNTMQKKLDLTGQKDHIDYSKKNFVHADLSIEEFQRLQKEKNESIISFAFKNAQNQAKDVKQPSTLKLLRGLITGNANLLKLSIVHTLGQGDDQIAKFAGDSVIIGDRNEKCLKVMNQQIALGKKQLGVFYGAAHFPDMEERMLRMGFKKEKQTWLTAWDIDKN